MIADLKYALRQMRKSPGFTVIAALTLALGIGACTAVFSVINTTILHPFSYPGLDRLVDVNETFLPQNPKAGVSPGAYAEYRKQNTVFTSLAASFSQPHNITRSGDPVRAFTQHVTANFFSTLGVQPILGRDFRPEEDVPGKGNVAILSHRLWQSDFGGLPGVIGQTIDIDGQPTTIIGVTPADFQPQSPDPRMYMPLALPDQFRLSRAFHFLAVVGRLKDGVTLERAGGELSLVASRLARQFPDTNKGWGVSLISLVDDKVEFARPLLYTLLGAVGFLLLIACVNIANLLLVRATARQKEISIRLALGASRTQIVRQFLCESVLLASCGGALGLLLAQWSMKLMVSVSPVDLPRIDTISVDRQALLFSCALMLVTGIGFGIFPALQATRVNLNDVLKDSGRGTSEGRHGQRLRQMLVVSEVALALVLLVGAGLLTRSFLQFQDIDQGFQRKDLYMAPFNLNPKKYPDAASQINFANQALERVAHVHGITAECFCLGRALVSGGSGFLIAGRPAPPPSAMPNTTTAFVTPDFLKTAGIPLIRGRTFTPQDIATTTPVIIINQELARLYFPDTNPIGQRINLTANNPAAVAAAAAGAAPPPPVWREVVGVVGNARVLQPDDPIRSQVYVPFAQNPGIFLVLGVRTAPGTALDIRGVCNAVRSLDQDIPLTMLWEMTRVNDKGAPAARRFSMALSIVFSVIALILAAIGIYGVMAFNVAQRTGEIGIRMSLGAQGSDVLKMVLANGGRMVGLGLAIGLAGAFAAARVIGSFLYKLSAYDPVTMIGITLVLALVGFLACWLPARRATKVDPAVALRNE